MCGILCLIQYGGSNIDVDMANECLEKLNPRGPDQSNFIVKRLNTGVEIYLGFTRLAIMDLSDDGMQPFQSNQGDFVICNGEIYNYKKLANNNKIETKTNCDCEVLLPLFNKLGINFYEELDGEYAMVIVDKSDQKIFAVRDKYGVRPLYVGFDRETKIIGFASELKALHPIMESVEQVKPWQTIEMSFNLEMISGLTADVSDLIQYNNREDYPKMSFDDITEYRSEWIRSELKNILTNCVSKRLHSDRPIGFLLSGGLDSSLITSIASNIIGPQYTTCFSIGIDGSPDVEAAKKVIAYLGIPEKNHHIIPFDTELGLQILPNVIRDIETYDITTIRASTPQYLMANYIKEQTNIRVVLSGEGSDEIHGSYRYFRDAPNAYQFHTERTRLLRELTYFDNKRTDRTMAAHGIEVRIPFLDPEYVDFVMKIDPNLLMYKTNQMEKQLLRDSFIGSLPTEILYRSKEAFSDAVSTKEINWANSIKELANNSVFDMVSKDSGPTNSNRNKFAINKPRTPDALYFRKIFDINYYNRDNIIPHYWLPRFQKEDVLDPSATILNCY